VLLQAYLGVPIGALGIHAFSQVDFHLKRFSAIGGTIQKKFLAITFCDTLLITFQCSDSLIHKPIPTPPPPLFGSFQQPDWIVSTPSETFQTYVFTPPESAFPRPFRLRLSQFAARILNAPQATLPRPPVAPWTLPAFGPTLLFPLPPSLGCPRFMDKSCHPSSHLHLLDSV
jgi:hypothetical protein